MSGTLATALRLGALLLVLVGLSLLRGSTSSAQTPTVLGIDVAPGSNTAGLVDTVDTCVEVAVGDRFPIDIYVADVESLRAWELRFAFDSDVVQIVDYDYNLFLGGVFSSLFEVEKPDRYFLAAAEPRTPDSGSGVLARLTLEAVGSGVSPAEIVMEPGYLAPRLSNVDNVQGNDLFAGPVSQAKVAVAEPCRAEIPTSTSPPAPGATPNPTSDGTPHSDKTPAAVLAIVTRDGVSVRLPGAAISLTDSPPVLSEEDSPPEGEEDTGSSAEEGDDGRASGSRRITIDDGSSGGLSAIELALIIAAGSILATGSITTALILRTRGGR